MKDTRTHLHRLSALLRPILAVFVLSGCATTSDQSGNDNNALLWTLGGALFGARAAQVGSVPGVAVGNAAQNYGLAEAGRSQVTVNNNSSSVPAVTAPPSVPTQNYQAPSKPVIGDIKYFSDKKLHTGTVYTGPMKLCDNWEDWRPHGLGQLTLSNDSQYVGQFKDGKMHGSGRFTWANGQQYKGEYKEGQKHGYGTYAWPDGQKYEGEWAGGQYNGQGKLTLPDGTVQEGEWWNGQLVALQTKTTNNNDKSKSEPSSTKYGILIVTGNIENCDILVDCKFTGNTPAKLKLTEGTHTIEVKKDGYKPYKKDVTVSEGSELTLRPTLQKE
jgi:hypothetical protein